MIRKQNRDFNRLWLTTKIKALLEVSLIIIVHPHRLTKHRVHFRLGMGRLLILNKNLLI